jgi:hypothetical protein
MHVANDLAELMCGPGGFLLHYSLISPRMKSGVVVRIPCLPGDREHRSVTREGPHER